MKSSMLFFTMGTSPEDLRNIARMACFTYEDLSIHPGALTGIQVYEPLRSWLEAQFSRG